MHEILCSTGCLVGRPNGRNHRIITEYAPYIHCDGFEFMIYDTWYDSLDSITAELADSGIPFRVVHCDKKIGELISQGDDKQGLALFETNCRTAAALGAKTLVLHLWNGLISDSHMDKCVEAYPKLWKIAEDCGETLTVENVVCNVHSPMSNLRLLHEEYPQIPFTFDTKMAEFHNELSDAFSDENRWLWDERHIKHMHINDYDGGYMDWSSLKTPQIGEGHIDFTAFFENLTQFDYTGDYTIEATSFLPSGEIDLISLNKSLDRVREYVRLSEDKYGSIRE